THAHGDHTGGVRLWREAGTEIIAQRAHGSFTRYQRTLAGFFGRRNAAQFGFGATPAAAAASGNVVAFQPTTTFEDRDTLTIGDVELDLIHTPGETPDHLTVWIPQYRAAFI